MKGKGRIQLLLGSRFLSLLVLVTVLVAITIGAAGLAGLTPVWTAARLGTTIALTRHVAIRTLQHGGEDNSRSGSGFHHFGRSHGGMHPHGPGSRAERCGKHDEAHPCNDCQCHAHTVISLNLYGPEHETKYSPDEAKAHICRYNHHQSIVETHVNHISLEISTVERRRNSQSPCSDT